MTAQIIRLDERRPPPYRLFQDAMTSLAELEGSVGDEEVFAKACMMTAAWSLARSIAANEGEFGREREWSATFIKNVERFATSLLEDVKLGWR